MTVTIPVPDQIPDLPLWGWITVGAVVWYVIAAVGMRLFGQGPRIYREWKVWNDPITAEWAAYEKMSVNEREQRYGSRWDGTKYVAGQPAMGCPPCLAVAGRLLVSPLEYLAWWPFVLLVYVASLPFLGVLRLASGPVPKTESSK